MPVATGEGPRDGVDVAVVGAGVIGLACAAGLARAGASVLVLERHDGPARETSARNSGVVHAGLYYPEGSWAARTCVEGRGLLYARCAREGIAHRRVGKLVLAVEDAELEVLARLKARGEANGAGALALLTPRELREREPRVRALAALACEESGIVDAHGLAASYLTEARAAGASVAWRTTVLGVAAARPGFVIETRDADGAGYAVRAERMVNAAGLSAGKVARCAGLDVEALAWTLHPCKGDYFRLASHLSGVVRQLVYPVPGAAGLGIHLTMDLGGVLRAGPDAEYVDAPHYEVDPAKAARFGAAVRRYLPELSDADLTPDYAGVRPKRYGAGEPWRDFVIEARPAGLVHLIGIESPGLTASEAIAREVVRLLS